MEGCSLVLEVIHGLDNLIELWCHLFRRNTCWRTNYLEGNLFPSREREREKEEGRRKRDTCLSYCRISDLYHVCLNATSDMQVIIVLLLGKEKILHPHLKT